MRTIDSKLKKEKIMKTKNKDYMIYWFTGQPSAGKTTLAAMLFKFLSSPKKIHIDGDDLRNVFDNKDYSEEGRRKNIERAQDIALFLNSQRYDVVVSLVSPYKDQREQLKTKTNVTEIYLHTTDDRGKNDYHVENYQPPSEIFIDMDTTKLSPNEAFEKLLMKIFPID
jgi:adenylylsulfate kinase-like enzyme